METNSNDDNDVFQAIIFKMIIVKDFCQFTKEFKTYVFQLFYIFLEFFVLKILKNSPRLFSKV